jgi:hypothetical protein
VNVNGLSKMLYKLGIIRHNEPIIPMQGYVFCKKFVNFI